MHTHVTVSRYLRYASVWQCSLCTAQLHCMCQIPSNPPLSAEGFDWGERSVIYCLPIIITSVHSYKVMKELDRAQQWLGVPFDKATPNYVFRFFLRDARRWEVSSIGRQWPSRNVSLMVAFVLCTSYWIAAIIYVFHWKCSPAAWWHGSSHRGWSKAFVMSTDAQNSVPLFAEQLTTFFSTCIHALIDDLTV